MKIHTRKKPLAEDVTIEQLADHTDGNEVVRSSLVSSFSKYA
jgi:SpoVK/Ycf46/Vps4 family AAA+-type ATPase